MTGQESRDILLICLGEISGPHGVQGQVRLKSHTQNPQDIAAYGPLLDASGEHRFDIVELGYVGKALVARLEGITDRDAAERLCGTTLHVPRDRLPEPDAEEWYYSDLIGCTVVDEAGNSVGSVIAVQDFGAGDLLEVRFNATGQTAFVPLTAESVPNIDIEARQIMVIPPEGLLE